MALFKSEGIVIQAIDYRDSDQIATVYTQQEGMIKLMCHRAHSSKRGPAAPPLTQAEFVYQKSSRGEIFTCKEIAIISHHLSLRSHYGRLTAAFQVAKALLVSQAAQSPAKKLYQLLVSYLNQIGKSHNPQALAASFCLKILRHDGLFHPMDCCALCQNPLNQGFFLSAGESFCTAHQPPHAIFMTESEAQAIAILACSRSYQELANVPLTAALENKIAVIFTSQFS